MKPQVQVTEIKQDARWLDSEYNQRKSIWAVDLIVGEDVTRLAWFRYELDARQFAEKVESEMGDDV